MTVNFANLPSVKFSPKIPRHEFHEGLYEALGTTRAEVEAREGGVAQIAYLLECYNDLTRVWEEDYEKLRSRDDEDSRDKLERLNEDKVLMNFAFDVLADPTARSEYNTWLDEQSTAWPESTPRSLDDQIAEIIEKALAGTVTGDGTEIPDAVPMDEIGDIGIEEEYPDEGDPAPEWTNDEAYADGDKEKIPGDVSDEKDPEETALEEAAPGQDRWDVTWPVHQLTTTDPGNDFTKTLEGIDCEAIAAAIEGIRGEAADLIEDGNKLLAGLDSTHLHEVKNDCNPDTLPLSHSDDSHSLAMRVIRGDNLEAILPIMEDKPEVIPILVWPILLVMRARKDMSRGVLSIYLDMLQIAMDKAPFATIADAPLEASATEKKSVCVVINEQLGELLSGLMNTGHDDIEALRRASDIVEAVPLLSQRALPFVIDALAEHGNMDDAAGGTLQYMLERIAENRPDVFSVPEIVRIMSELYTEMALLADDSVERRKHLGKVVGIIERQAPKRPHLAGAVPVRQAVPA